MMKFRAFKSFYFDANTGGGNGGSSTSGGDGSNAGGSGGQNDDGANGSDGNKPDGDSSQKTGTQDEKKFTQQDIDKIVADRLTRERQKQEREAAEKQGEFQKLYEAVKPQFDTLQEEVATLRKQIEQQNVSTNAQIDAQIKDWPEELKVLDPGAENLEARKAWVERGRVLAEKLGKPNAPNLEGGSKGKQEQTTGNVTSQFMANRYGPDKS